MKRVNILAIGGSDPSSGAGIQSDIRASLALGANCFSVITAITSQNSSKFFDIERVSPNMVKQQIDSVFSDFDVDIITIGMIHNSSTIQQIHKSLSGKNIPIILDPVIRSTTGGMLLEKSALSIFKKILIPITHIITPNVKEAETLSGISIRNTEDLVDAAKKISSLGVKNVIITGHPFIKNTISDFVYNDRKYYSISGKKILGENHGSGCNFAIGLAYSTAKKNDLDESVKFAKKFTFNSIKNAQNLGQGVKITNPEIDNNMTILEHAINEFQNLDHVDLLIPECQTNFVIAKPHAKSINDVIGVTGRIVKAGNKIIIAGNLEYGGSKHVASAVLAMQKKFPQVRSALNIKYNEKIIEKFKKAKKTIVSYDREKEPARIKLKENSSVFWGVREAIKKITIQPDVVYHTGDFGKEPMIIVFGKSPTEVVEKISVIL